MYKGRKKIQNGILNEEDLRLVNNSTNALEYWQHFIKGYKAKIVKCVND